MLVTFDEYQAAGGKALTDEEAYNQTEPLVEKLIEAYIQTRIPYWRVLPLEEYGLDLTFAIVNQVDFIEAHGGIDAFTGASDLTLKTVTTSGFSYNMDNSKLQMVVGLPLSGLAMADIDNQLLQAGLRSLIL